MDSARFDEIEELKRELREQFPWKREAIVNMAYSVVGLTAVISLSVIATLASYLGSDPTLWVAIAGFSGLAAVLVARTLVTNSRLLRVQMLLIRILDEQLQSPRQQ